MLRLTPQAPEACAAVRELKGTPAKVSIGFLCFRFLVEEPEAKPEVIPTKARLLEGSLHQHTFSYGTSARLSLSHKLTWKLIQALYTVGA